MSRKIIPSFLLKVLLLFANINPNILIIINTNISIIALISTIIGDIAALAPKINKILKIFEPTTLPNARSFSPFFEATTEVTNSGSDVPIATIVNPIKVSLHPNYSAISVALFTTRSPPHTIPARPIIIHAAHFKGCMFSDVSASLFSFLALSAS